MVYCREKGIVTAIESRRQTLAGDAPLFPEEVRRVNPSHLW